MTFKKYLQQRQLSTKTIKTYERYLKVFFNWLESTGTEAEALTYTGLLDYIGYCYKRGLKQNYTNKLMGVVRHYYNYLKYMEKIQNNPAAGLYIRGKTRRLPHDLLSTEQLEALYTNYQPKGLAGKRNKIMLGLMIYQGLTTGELELLEPHHLKLREGKIEVPGSRKSNRRILKLEAHQMIDLQEYTLQVRQVILDFTGKQSGKLFVSIGSGSTIHNSMDKLMRHLRKTHEYFINAQQIRQSRLAIWVKHHDVRQVQYMAGHKYVSSTERYQSIYMESLQKELDKHHPSEK